MWSESRLIKAIKKGGIAVIPTDTIYGIVAQAEDENAVKKLYEIRQRTPEKPCIILIGSKDELKKFGIFLTQSAAQELDKYWPGPVSIILSCLGEKFAYLHRGSGTLAFRLPASQELRELLKATGPLVAPSANIEGQPPAKNISEAQKYFDDKVNYYLDGGEITSKASKIIRLQSDGTVTIIRE